MKFPKINNFKNPLKQVKYDIYMKKNRNYFFVKN